MTLCTTCYGLPHRRPRGGLCRCGEAYAAEVIERPSLELRSSAGRWDDEPRMPSTTDVRGVRRALTEWLRERERR